MNSLLLTKSYTQIDTNTNFRASGALLYNITIVPKKKDIIQKTDERRSFKSDSSGMYGIIPPRKAGHKQNIKHFFAF